MCHLETRTLEATLDIEALIRLGAIEDRLSHRQYKLPGLHTPTRIT
jgi:hypothetical protein